MARYQKVARVFRKISGAWHEPRHTCCYDIFKLDLDLRKMEFFSNLEGAQVKCLEATVAAIMARLQISKLDKF